MRFVLFYHSLISCWNHGNAHFLRGLVRELRVLGHDVHVFEPRDNWSLRNLLNEQGAAALAEFRRVYPGFDSEFYDPSSIDLDQALRDADVVIVHEWSDCELVARIGAHRRRHGHYRLLFHDSHHRSATAPESMAAYDLTGFDGVLAFGDVIAAIYRKRGWVRRAWTWHEAADVRHYYPRNLPLVGDLVWVGNWGDDEREEEIREFLIEPVKALGLRATVYGVRYPTRALEALKDAAIRYGGWIPASRVPLALSQHRMTVHIPRRPYAASLPGIPTIRVFEALACGTPLVSAPWRDVEGLFAPGEDFVLAADGAEMTRLIGELISNDAQRRALSIHGLRTVLARHTCRHRAVQLLSIVRSLEATDSKSRRPRPAVAPARRGSHPTREKVHGAR